MSRAGWLALAAAVAASACGSTPPVEAPAPATITVAVTSPAPGAELLASESRMIVVSGTVATSDATRGALEAWVNGVRVEVKAGAFTTQLAPEVGVNHIKVEGGDGIGELVGHEFDVLWAPAYLVPLAGQTGFDLAGALELHLGQRFFDARLFGTTLDRSTNPVVAHDIASALELVLWHVDLARLLPGGLHVSAGGASLDIAIPSATPANIMVDARVVDGAQSALDLNIDLLGVLLATEGSVVFSGRTLQIHGGITADMHASARLTLGIGSDGAIAVAVTSVTAVVGSLVPGFTGPNADELDGLIAIGGNDFSGLVESLVSTQLIPTFTDRVPPLLKTLLGATDQVLNNIQFTLDTGIGHPVMLQLDGQIGALDVRAGAANGHVTVRQDLTVRTTGAPVHPSSRGAPRVNVSTADPVLNTASLHLTMREDFLNALLHALWNAGMLDGQLTQGSLTAKLSAHLPPVVRPTPPSSPCKIDGERCDVVLQLGQVDVELPSFGQSFGVSATAGARIAVNGGTVSLMIQKVPDLRVWDTSATRGSLSPEAVSGLIGTLVWPKLFGAIGDNLAISLPLPDIAALGLGDLAPGLANAQLLLEMRQRPTISGQWLVLGADLNFATPPPP